MTPHLIGFKSVRGIVYFNVDQIALLEPTSINIYTRLKLKTGDEFEIPAPLDLVMRSIFRVRNEESGVSFIGVDKEEIERQLTHLYTSERENPENITGILSGWGE